MSKILGKDLGMIKTITRLQRVWCNPPGACINTRGWLTFFPFSKRWLIFYLKNSLWHWLRVIYHRLYIDLSNRMNQTEVSFHNETQYAVPEDLLEKRKTEQYRAGEL